MDNKRLAEIETRMCELRSMLQGADKVDLEAVEKEINSLNSEREEIRQRGELAQKINDNQIESTVLGKVEKETRNMNNNILDSMEYREAFMDFCKTGVMAEEFRATAMTAANTAVIPTATLDRIIEKLEAYGNILSLVTRVAYPAGVIVPVGNMGITATWTTEGSMSEKQGVNVGSVVFGGFKLQSRVAVSLELGVKSLAAFENAIVENVSKAMAKALEAAIVAGDGEGKPTGIISANVPADRVVTLTSVDFKTLNRIEAAIPTAYDNTAVYVMNKKTYMEFEAMEDKNGQPVARTSCGLNGKPERMLLGRTVELCDYLPTLASAKTGEVVAFAADLSGYVLNTNYNIGVRKYFDEDTDEYITKATLIADGKPVDTESIVLIKAPAKG